MKLLIVKLSLLLGVFLPIFTKAQLRIHTDVMLHSTIIFEPYMPKKVPNLGAKVGATYPLFRGLLLEVSAAYYQFDEKIGRRDESHQDYTSYTEINLYTTSKALIFEPSIHLYIVPKRIYFKTGYYVGLNQIQSNSGSFNEITYSYTLNSSSSSKKTPFNYQYSKGIDRGLLLGSGLCFNENKKLQVNLEVLFRMGGVLCTRTNLVNGEVVSNRMASYFAFCPALRFSYNLGK